MGHPVRRASLIRILHEEAGTPYSALDDDALKVLFPRNGLSSDGHARYDPDAQLTSLVLDVMRTVQYALDSRFPSCVIPPCVSFPVSVPTA